jgi:hypothetical protein
MCSTISRGSTTRSGVTRRSGVSVLLSSNEGGISLTCCPLNRQQTDRQPFRPTVPRTIVHGVRSADVVPTALVNIARSCTVALTPCFPSQRRPRASCLRSFRSWPTGSLRARRSASAACRMSGDETGSGSSGRILRSSLAMEGIFVGYCLSPDRMPRLRRCYRAAEHCGGSTTELSVSGRGGAEKRRSKRPPQLAASGGAGSILTGSGASLGLFGKLRRPSVCSRSGRAQL